MADTPPDLAARIESLQASHVENPARFFMPLASAYREAGRGELAEKLLRENLKRHPGYLSAHVLLGRCLADRGAVEEARNEFQYVLSVDSQNLIALRSLGDMAAAEGDRGGAMRWYGELLAVDPMNAEAKQAMAGLESEPAGTAATDGEKEFGMVDLDAGTADEGEAAVAAEPEVWGEVSLDAEPADASASEEDTAAEAPVDMEAWGEVALDAQPAEAAADAGEDAPSFDALEFGTVDVSASSASDAAAETAPASSDAWGSLDDGQLDEIGATPLDGLGGYAEDLLHDGDEHEVVTETMAELYARQGFLDRAADVYKELIGLRGEEPALVRRLEELQAEMRAGRAPAPVEKPVAAPEPDAEAPSWLETVDAVASGEPEPALPDLELETGFEPAPASADAAAEEAPGATPLWAEAEAPAADEAPEAPEPESAASEAPAASADPFADSFADGFAAEGEEAAAAAEEESASADDLPSVVEAGGPIGTVYVADEEPAAAEPSDEAVDEEPAAAAEPSEEEPASAEVEAPQPVRTIREYLAGILSWRPGSSAAPSAVEPPPADAAPEPVATEPPVESAPAAEEETADEPWATPSAEPEPWSTPEPAAAEAEDEPWASASPELEAPEPAADETKADGGDLPWLSAGLAEAEVPPPDGFLPQETGADAEPAPHEGVRDDDLMPWETPFDLAGEAAEAPTTDRAAPRQEPTAAPESGFSFDDFFAEQPAAAPPPAEPEAAPALELEPLPAAEPTPPQASAPAPPAAAPSPPPPSAPSGDDDEDLESFQAWLQSLKR